MRRCTTLLIAGLLAACIPSPVLSQEADADAEKDKAAREQWLATKQKIEASGFVFDLNKHTPPAVPDAEKNFAAHPLVAENFTLAARKNPESTSLGKIDVRKVPNFPKPPLGFKTSPHELFDLSSRAGDPTLDRDAAASVILKALDTWKLEFKALAQAAGRPRSSFPFTWEKPLIEVNYSVPNGVNSHLCWRALCYLQLELVGEATADTLTLMRLTQHNSKNPSAIALLATIAANQFALRPIRDGIEQQRWNEAALQRFDIELARLSFPEQYHKSVLFELAFSERLSMDWLDGKLKAEDFAPRTPKGLDNPIPHAIYRKLNTASEAIFDVVLDKQVASPFHLPERLKRMKAFAGAAGDRDDARKAVATKYAFGIRSLRAQAEVSNARVAIAVERYRLKHGKLPDTLDGLTPTYLAELPQDPMTGKPPRFGVLPDASIVIYSLGWDGDDDGGTPVSERGNRDGDGDWVWKTRLPLTKK